MNKRSDSDKQKIEANISAPYQIENFITEEERTLLINFFKSSDEKIKKNTGPLTLGVSHEQLKLPFFQSILERLKPILGDVEVFTCLFFYVEYPHIIHNDDSFDLPLCYKGVNIPLEIDKPDDAPYPALCFFDQYYLEGPAKFFNGSTSVATYYNTQVYEYSDVKNKTDVPFDENIRLTNFSHIKPMWLEGLSFNSKFENIPGNVIIFDTVRLHCASNFMDKGVKSKLGLSVFTKLK